MSLYNLSLIISILISMFFQSINYRYLTDNKKINVTFNKIIYVLIIFILIVLNNKFDTDLLKAPIGFLLIMILNRTIYRDPYNIVINTTSISYAIAVLVEIILTVIFIKVNMFDMYYLSHNVLLMTLFSFTTNFVSYCICKYVKVVKRGVFKINKLSFSNIYRRVLVGIYLIILLLIDFKNIYLPSVLSYIVGLLLVILIFVIFISYLNDEFKIRNEIEKVDILLNNISNYEQIIDDNRINSHEMLNNLLLLKSYKNKNSKKFEKLLDDLIIMYDKNGKSIRNISVLPKGLKGIIYYKINDLEKLGYEVRVNISKQVSSEIEKINNENFVVLCKCFSILLDNAIDACCNLNEKIISIDIYKENKCIILSICNTCEKEVEIEFINKKNYSTKGKKRGLGLYIVNNLLDNCESINLKQENLGKYFESKLIVKNKKD